ncbi:MAG: GNAT family N-acetyltransferase [Anaerolineales bacterium]
MSGSFRIRRGTSADIPVITRHRLGMFTEMRIGDPSDFDAYASEFREFASQAMTTGAFHSWLAETESGEIVGGGAIMVVPWPASPNARKQQRAFLLNVFTEPAFRRKGIARSLVQTMVDWCRGQGFGSVFLHASDAGRPLYQSLGFHPTTELRFDF